jgi:hypothetical protein
MPDTNGVLIPVFPPLGRGIAWKVRQTLETDGVEVVACGVHISLREISGERAREHKKYKTDGVQVIERRYIGTKPTRYFSVCVV